MVKCKNVTFLPVSFFIWKILFFFFFEKCLRANSLETLKIVHTHTLLTSPSLRLDEGNVSLTPLTVDGSRSSLVRKTAKISPRCEYFENSLTILKKNSTPLNIFLKKKMIISPISNYFRREKFSILFARSIAEC